MCLADNDEVCCPRFPGNEVGRQFEGGAPFDLLEMLALECGTSCPFHRNVLSPPDSHAPKAHRTRQRLSQRTWAAGQARDANECCLKALGQIKRQLDPLFAIALDIEMDHHCGKRHYPFPCSDRRKLLASFSNAP